MNQCHLRGAEGYQNQKKEEKKSVIGTSFFPSSIISQTKTHRQREMNAVKGIADKSQNNFMKIHLD